jgi:hypothetical protein
MLVAQLALQPSYTKTPSCVKVKKASNEVPLWWQLN